MTDSDIPKAKWIPSPAFAIPIARRVVLSVILHSSQGSTIQDLMALTAARDRSTHLYITRSAYTYQLVRLNNIAWHVASARKPEWSNLHSIGITLEHIDAQDDWPDTQILAIARIVTHLRSKLGDLKLLGHADVASPIGLHHDPLHLPWMELHVCCQRIADSLSRPPTSIA